MDMWWRRCLFIFALISVHRADSRSLLLYNNIHTSREHRDDGLLLLLLFYSLHFKLWLMVNALICCVPFIRSGAILCIIEDVLTPSDAAEVVEELLPAQNKSYELGLKLNLPQYEVENIHSSYSKQEKRLLHVIMQFLNQVEPRPTWRVIIDALRSRLVNLPQLGQELAACHFLEPIPSCVPEVAGKSKQDSCPQL